MAVAAELARLPRINGTGGKAEERIVKLEEQVRTLVQVLEQYIYIPSRFLGEDLGAGAGSGEANTASNLGAGTGLVTTKSGVDLPFKSLVAGTNVSLANDANTVTISATDTGEVNTNSNAGATGTGLVKTKVGVDTPVKRLIGGTNVTLTDGTDAVTISAASSSGYFEQGEYNGNGIVETSWTTKYTFGFAPKYVIVKNGTAGYDAWHVLKETANTNYVDWLARAEGTQGTTDVALRIDGNNLQTKGNNRAWNGSSDYYVVVGFG